MFDNTIFEKIDSEEKAYWLGFLEADGCLHSGKGDYRIELGLKEREGSIKFKLDSCILIVLFFFNVFPPVK